MRRGPGPATCAGRGLRYALRPVELGIGRGPCRTTRTALLVQALHERAQVQEQGGAQVLVAIGAIKKGEKILSVPKSEWIDGGPGPDLKQFADAEPWLRLCLRLMDLRHRKANAYVSSLPSDPDCPVW